MSKQADQSNEPTSHLTVILYKALKELTDISGEATITMDSVKAVRKMARFVRARENAQKALAEAEPRLISQPHISARAS